MKRNLVLLAALPTALFASCSFPHVVPEATNTEFKALGEVRLYNRSVSFDDYRVRGPHCNLAKRTDGSWAGVLHGSAIDVTVTDTTIRGVGFTLSRESSEPGRLVMTGQSMGKMYRFEIDENQALIRGPSTSATSVGRTIGDAATVWGTRGEFQMRGEAGQEIPPWPQIAFALVGLFD
jgi:hypothetical protein